MRLNRETLSRVPGAVYKPRFDPALLKPGIVHLGCGNFHRAHQATATQAAIGAEGQDGLNWGIVSATMRHPELAIRLREQDNLYTLLTREPGGTVASIIGALTETVFAGDEHAALTERIADPQTRIVTLTVTATGYYLTAADRLDPAAPAIRDDLAADIPRTAPGILATALALIRKRRGTPPVILCCDNVSHNGQTLRQAVMDFAALRGADALAGWIGSTVQFPDTMVDRIVPVSTADDPDDARLLLGGLEDQAPISAEPWFQWIIGPFDGPRPRWEAHPGTRFVSDVGVFERAKLQMLNGTHMLLAYTGALAGLGTISEAVCDLALGHIAARFMRDEQTADVDLPAKILDSYTQDLIVRFRNPGIVHEADRVGRNGSAKMATRIIRPMRSNIEAGRPVPGATLLIASWIRWFALHEQEALEISLSDPRADTLRQICASARNDHRAQAEAFLAMEDIFGPPLPDHDRQVTGIARLLRALTEKPVPAVLRELSDL
ncbi:mannitol dehydrogenase family protein [Acetobacter oeni]|uniref:Mannitol dehydrogenase n=1 Tax=Acetobacter oeni TaxID=304077 RepID=A0A511XMA2_9PROT|nr:mannitol dehydrogenase family protein [Acetobacter oeni]MBB3884087.1 fructuronate reductase [Acetobacter oeni]NHO20092.1 mannitol dehydrogenase family protein [Acetobacter oeni]GBR02527.1 D-mannonate oxidoreductase [Acetobacter oeni LMG 21952]GEN64072.1 mannitol dehydrogenase [Acetobacter oeni]